MRDLYLCSHILEPCWIFAQFVNSAFRFETGIFSVGSVGSTDFQNGDFRRGLIPVQAAIGSFARIFEFDVRPAER